MFQHIEQFNGELRLQFNRFINKLSFHTELRWILVLEENATNQQMLQQDALDVLKMTYLTKSQAVDLLKRILYVEGKTALIKGVDLESHKVI